MKKQIKNWLMINTAFILCGVLLLVAGILKGGQLLIPLGCGCIASGVVKSVRLIKILRSGDEGIRKYMARFDERNTLVSARAGNGAFKLSLIIGFLATSVLALTGYEAVAMVVAYVICIFCVINLVCYWYYWKKY